MFFGKNGPEWLQKIGSSQALSGTQSGPPQASGRPMLRGQRERGRFNSDNLAMMLLGSGQILNGQSPNIGAMREWFDIPDPAEAKRGQATRDMLTGPLGMDRGMADALPNDVLTQILTRAAMDRLPKYQNGTQFHPGGAAIVGEDGPEVVELPYGAAVHPNPQTPQQPGPGMPPTAPSADMDLIYDAAGSNMIDGNDGADYLGGEDIGAIQKRAAQDSEALKIKHSLMSVMESLDDYARIYREGGGRFMPGTQKDKLTAQRRAIQMQMKDLYNLGALQGPDLALLESLMVDPTSIGANLLDRLGVSDLDGRMSANDAQLRDILKDLAAPRLREYGIAVDDVQSLRRPETGLTDAELLQELGLE